MISDLEFNKSPLATEIPCTRVRSPFTSAEDRTEASTRYDCPSQEPYELPPPQGIAITASSLPGLFWGHLLNMPVCTVQILNIGIGIRSESIFRKSIKQIFNLIICFVIIVLFTDNEIRGITNIPHLGRVSPVIHLLTSLSGQCLR